MLIETQCPISADPGPTWDLLMDVPRAALCVPGLKEITPKETGSGEGDGFQASLQARVGPISLTFSGTIQVVERDQARLEAKYRVEGSDRRVGGSFRSVMTVRLESLAPGETVLTITADTAFMGKLGELGQPLIRRKARTSIEQFAKNLAQQLNTSGS